MEEPDGTVVGAANPETDLGVFSGDTPIGPGLETYTAKCTTVGTYEVRIIFPISGPFFPGADATVFLTLGGSITGRSFSPDFATITAFTIVAT